jgi:hypothetical protein
VALRVAIATLAFLIAAMPSAANDGPQPAGALEAAFSRESYSPGSAARLRVWTAAGRTTIQVFRSGTETAATRADDVMLGTSVTPPRTLAHVDPGQSLSVRIGRWPSGLYFARLRASGRVGYAPFVVRPARLGRTPVAVVLPTRTWQAYNFRDDDGDGSSDTWYAMHGSQEVRLARPFLNRGVPPHFRRYDLRLLRWLHATNRTVDVLAQEDLDETSGARLAASYRWLVFPGHHEYVTAAEYDAVTAFRDLGGNLAFLSANNFFWRIDVRGGSMRRVAKWRDLGRPEAALIGVQYLASDRGRRKAPWLVRWGPVADVLFTGIPLGPGGAFSLGNVEIDATTPSSPPGIEVVAEIPDLLGPGLTAQMTYYETAAGAKVFAAGAFTLAGNVYDPAVRRFLRNLWSRLSQP